MTNSKSGLELPTLLTRPAAKPTAHRNGTTNGAVSSVPGLVGTNGHSRSLKIVILGLSITSSWGNGHATTYRGLVRELQKRGHRVLFLERDLEWYASNRDLPNPPFCETQLYSSLDALKADFSKTIGDADVVIVGSYVPEGIAIGEWVT